MRLSQLRAAALTILTCGGTALGQAVLPSAGSPDEPASGRHEIPVSLRAANDNLTIVGWDAVRMRESWVRGRPLYIVAFPIAKNKSVDLILEPFKVTTPNTRFVLGRKNGPDRPLDYDPNSISLFRGSVAGVPGSSVYLALGDRISTGTIEMAPGGEKFLISSKDADGRDLGAGTISVFRPSSSAALSIAAPICGNDGRADLGTATSPIQPLAAARVSVTPLKGLEHLELAVETDFEFFSLFGNTTDAADYLVAMYGQISAIYLRDVGVWVDLVFARVWDDPDDLFNNVDPSPLSEFRIYWETNMGAVSRDAAQLFSGRRDYPFGGQAYLSVLCGSFAYGVVGYAAGTFATPTSPDAYNYDVTVCAHELGHNAGTGHTHDVGIDTCDDPGSTPQRGSIMSYCGQTWSGGNANRDNYFHSVMVQNIQAHTLSVSCVTDDCNQNGIEDSIDIAGATSQDLNGNNSPDECDDCNSNGVLDDVDIAGATSTDLNGNDIPDDCEPDCNGNNVPDDRDIQFGTSTDAYGNGIPDECEEDCNSNGTSDYTEIQADMTLDKNRDARLDACQDCDGDNTTDLDGLNGAHSLWIASGQDNSRVREFYGDVGVLDRASPCCSSLVREGQDLIIAPNGNTWVTSALDDRVMEFNRAGTFLGNFVSTGAGGLDYPTGLISRANGDLLVASRDTDQVLRYNGATGAFIDAFVSVSLGGLDAPFGMTFGPNGNLFVTSATNEVIEYNGLTGALVGVFVSAVDNGGLDQPRGLTFKGDGNLLVCSFGTDETLEYDGTTGASLGKWAQVGTANRLTQDSPWGIRVGPNGNVYVVRTGTAFSSNGPAAESDVSEAVGAGGTGNLHLSNAQMYEFDVRSGNFLRTHIGGNDHGMLFPTGFDFAPGWDVDCNYNLLEDDCDITSGFSLDANANGIPDECEIDCNSNGVLDRLDIIPFGTSLDCNANLNPDECDIASGASPDCNGNGVPDECEPDCNSNGVADGCDVTGATSEDCNFNGIPDECERDEDCNSNGVRDICDIGGGTSSDCNGNDFPDECDVTGGGLILDVDFSSGLPAGWSTSGIFSITSSCTVNPTCDGAPWAYAGSNGSCSYGDNQVGELVSAPISLGSTVSELRYCSMVDTEAGFDFADVFVDGDMVDRLAGEFGVWEERVVDLTPYRGQTITLTFHMESDSFVSGTTGWQVDNIQITSGSADCASDGVPDECVPDSDSDGTLDSCEECPLEPALLSPSEPGVEVTCNDGIDNDCDGLTDNTDWDCNGGCPFACGDLDGSTTVDLVDFATFAVCFDQSPGISQACTCSDLNVDGVINLTDFATFALGFNSSPTNSPPNCP